LKEEEDCRVLVWNDADEMMGWEGIRWDRSRYLYPSIVHHCLSTLPQSVVT